MACKITCSISAIFIIGMIYMTNAMSNNDIIQKYQDQLPEDLIATYQEIVVERTRIYYMGYILGFVLAAIVIFYQSRRSKFSATSMVCTAVAISFLTNYFYYVLSPKSTHMLEHVKSEEQTIAWLEMYKGMQFHYHTSLAIGLVGVGVFAYAFRC